MNPGDVCPTCFDTPCTCPINLIVFSQPGPLRAARGILDGGGAVSTFHHRIVSGRTRPSRVSHRALPRTILPFQDKKREPAEADSLVGLTSSVE